MKDIKIEEHENEWRAYLHGVEIARSIDKQLLQEYLKDSVVTSPSR